MLNHQIDAINFLLRYPNKWSSYNDDVVTSEVVCSLVNLGIAKINECRQFKLKSATKANDFITARS